MIAPEAKTRMPCGGCQQANCRPCNLYATREDYRRHWQGLPPLVPEVGLHPPGDVLKSLIAERFEGLSLPRSRTGAAIIKKMNANEADWCVENLESLARQLSTCFHRRFAVSNEQCRGFIREACYMLPYDIMPSLHAQASDPDALQFVWMFWRPPADGNEIYWSIASVLAHASPARITVFGSHPGPWYTGEHIPFVSKGVSRDRVEKMQMIANHPATAEKFVWMMDDQYYLKPTTHAEVKIPRARLRTAKTKSAWGLVRTHTEATLREQGIRTYDYATHLPHFVEKSKLQDVFQRFQFNPPMLWETVYGCVHRNNPEPPEPYFHRLTKLETAERLKRATKNATLLNHIAGVWSAAVIETVKTGLPEPESLLRTEMKNHGSNYRKPNWEGEVVIDRNHRLIGVSKARATRYFATNGPKLEVEVVRTILSILKSGDVFFDLGANFGYHSLIAKTLHPGVEVHAFEPCRQTFRELQSVVRANSLKINCHNYGLSNRSGRAELLYSKVSDSSHSFHTENAPNHGSETVDIVRLDDFDLPAPTLMKIDVELHELQVLQGAQRTIKQHRPTLIIEMRPENENYQLIREFLSDYYARQLDKRNWLFTAKL